MSLTRPWDQKIVFFLRLTASRMPWLPLNWHSTCCKINKQLGIIVAASTKLWIHLLFMRKFYIIWENGWDWRVTGLRHYCITDALCSAQLIELWSYLSRCPDGPSYDNWEICKNQLYCTCEWSYMSFTKYFQRLRSNHQLGTSQVKCN
jgi:hypothetical protein